MISTPSPVKGETSPLPLQHQARSRPYALLLCRERREASAFRRQGVISLARLDLRMTAFCPRVLNSTYLPSAPCFTHDAGNCRPASFVMPFDRVARIVSPLTTRRPTPACSRRSSHPRIRIRCRPPPRHLFHLPEPNPGHMSQDSSRQRVGRWSSSRQGPDVVTLLASSRAHSRCVPDLDYC
jgi:hypothetical protein